jgi:hypothetical protein
LDSKQARAFEAFVAQAGDGLLRMATLLTSDQGLGEDVYHLDVQPSPTRGHTLCQLVPVVY